MLEEDSVTWLSSMSTQQRGVFFSAMIQNLTLAMRSVCHEGEGASLGIERARALNEAIHLASNYLLGICSGKEDTRWIGPTAHGLFLTKDPALLDQINQSWAHARREAESSRIS